MYLNNINPNLLSVDFFGLGEGYVGSCLDTGIDPKVFSTSKEENIPFV